MARQLLVQNYQKILQEVRDGIVIKKCTKPSSLSSFGHSASGFWGQHYIVLTDIGSDRPLSEQMFLLLCILFGRICKTGEYWDPLVDVGTDFAERPTDNKEQLTNGILARNAPSYAVYAIAAWGKKHRRKYAPYTPGRIVFYLP